jgi:lauroyl/myristoyl acyltransferase
MTDTPTARSIPTAARSVEGKEINLWQRVSFTVTHAVSVWMLFLLSRRGLYRFGRLFGTLEWLANYRRRRRFHRALEKVLGERPAAATRRQATREFFMHSRCNKLFYLISDCLAPDEAAGLMTIENQALLDEALARGHGVYLAMSHHGPHHVAAMLLAMKGYKVAGVRDRHEGGIRRFIQERFDRLHRESQRMRVIFADSFPREIYRCFKEGYVLGSAMDVSRRRRENQKAEAVTVFGQERHFLTGPLRIALRCRTPVIQAFILPERDFRFRFQMVEMLIDPDEMTDEEATVREAMRTYAGHVERFVRATPSLLSRV